MRLLAKNRHFTHNRLCGSKREMAFLDSQRLSLALVSGKELEHFSHYTIRLIRLK